MSPLAWLAARLLREGGEMLGEREGGRDGIERERESERKCRHLNGWRGIWTATWGVCVCVQLLAPLWSVCEACVYVSRGTVWRRGGTPIPRPPRSMRRLICQRICDCECRDGSGCVGVCVCVDDCVYAGRRFTVKDVHVCFFTCSLSLTHYTLQNTVNIWLVCTHTYTHVPVSWFSMLMVCVGKLMHESRCRVVALAHFFTAGCQSDQSATAFLCQQFHLCVCPHIVVHKCFWLVDARFKKCCTIVCRCVQLSVLAYLLASFRIACRLGVYIPESSVSHKWTRWHDLACVFLALRRRYVCVGRRFSSNRCCVCN